MNLTVRRMTNSSLLDERPKSLQKLSVIGQSHNEIWQQILSLDRRFSRIRPVLREDASKRTLYLRSRQELSRGTDRIHLQTDVNQTENIVVTMDPPLNSNKTMVIGCDRMAYKLLREKLLVSLYGSPPSVKSLPLGLSHPLARNTEEYCGHAMSASSVTGSMRSAKSTSDCAPSSMVEEISIYNGSIEESPRVLKHHNTKLAEHSLTAEGYSFSGIDHIFDHHAGAINRIRFANTDNSRLAVASSDGTISICLTWPPEKERTVLHVLFGGHTPATPITDVVWSFSNDYLVSTALDGTVCLWDTGSGSLRRIYPASSVDVGPALVCAFQPLNYNLLVVGGAWGRIQTLNLSTGKLIKKGKDQIHSTGFKSAKSLSWDTVTCTGQGCILSVTFDQGSGTTLWVGTDRGVIQSYSCQPATGHLTRSQRLNLATRHPALACDDPLPGDEVGPYGVALLPAALTRRKPRRFVSEAPSIGSSLRRRTTELLTNQTSNTAYPGVTSLSAYSWLVRETGDAYLLANAAGLGLLLFKISGTSISSSSVGALTLERCFPLKHRSPSTSSNCSLRMMRSCFAPLLSTGAHIIAGDEDGNVCVFDVLSKPATNTLQSIHPTSSVSSPTSGVITVLQGHHAPVLDVAIGWDENVLASADECGLVIIWRHRNLMTYDK
ncbi:WD repeat-containing protein 13 [Fasciola gigantica]|uniref:WD repeat-containing protein 13 n=1 Tax=Fasciola gigantica TaxID=46835 RepID=A0A504Z1B2_FASGI|nr:WD repeat-containing protein 13 [Fasciola gigantica]